MSVAGYSDLLTFETIMPASIRYFLIFILAAAKAIL